MTDDEFRTQIALPCVDFLEQAAADMYSGYVHGRYSHVMEMYGGGPPAFHMRGMSNTPRVDEWRKALIFQFNQAVNVFAFMCAKLGLSDRCLALVQMRQSMEQALGMAFSTTPEEMIKKVKKGRTLNNQ